MVGRRRQTTHLTPPVADWNTRDFACRGLVPPHCTPEALARALERERGICIRFVPHPVEEPGVSGMLYRHQACDHTYSILFCSTPNLALRRLIWFHELAHLLFDDLGTDAGGDSAQRGPLVTNATEARAEAFAVGAMQYSFSAEDLLPTDSDDAVSTSAFGQVLQRIGDWPCMANSPGAANACCSPLRSSRVSPRG